MGYKAAFGVPRRWVIGYRLVLSIRRREGGSEAFVTTSTPSELYGLISFTELLRKAKERATRNNGKKRKLRHPLFSDCNLKKLIGDRDAKALADK